MNMTDHKITKPTIVIATPHARNDSLEKNLRERLASYEVIRLRSREDLFPEKLELLLPKFIFFPHWSWLIPEDIHTRFECVVFHMTDLPYGRGGSPLQNLIVRGHKETKLTALRCVNEPTRICISQASTLTYRNSRGNITACISVDGRDDYRNRT